MGFAADAHLLRDNAAVLGASIKEIPCIFRYIKRPKRVTYGGRAEMKQYDKIYVFMLHISIHVCFHAGAQLGGYFSNISRLFIILFRRKIVLPGFLIRYS